MSQTESATLSSESTGPAEPPKVALPARHVCPYCGQQNATALDACPRCTMEDSPATRQATKARIGPWYVLQNRNPSAPGMKYATLLSLIRKGYITPRSVLRGPTTYQLWRFAAHVRGVSREFGTCYSCGGAIIKTASFCPACQRSQEPPAQPDILVEPRTQPAQPIVNERAIEPVRHEPIEPARTDAIEHHQSAETTAPIAHTYARRLRDLNRQREQTEQKAASTALATRQRTSPVFRGDSRVVSAMDLAAALRETPPDSYLVPSRRRFKVVAAALALIVASVGAAAYLRPDYRVKTVTWLNSTASTIRAKVSNFNWSNVLTPSSPAAKPATRPDGSLTRNTVRQPGSGVRTAMTNQPNASLQRTTATPSTQPQFAAVDNDASGTDSEAAIDQARTLWGQAIDAEARQDFGSAVNLYEQIRQLPNDAWPGGLQINLDLARKRLQSSSAR